MSKKKKTEEVSSFEELMMSAKMKESSMQLLEERERTGWKNLIQKKCPVYLHLPLFVLVSNWFEKQVTSSVKHYYLTVEPHVVYKTNQLLPVANKDVLPALQNGNVIYQFSCHCDSRYVGRTPQRLQYGIKQHVPKSIRYGTSSPKRHLPIRKWKYSTKSTTQIQSLTHDSVIGLYLLRRNSVCAQHYDESMFSILVKGRSLFHLSALEATFIKTSNPFINPLQTKRIRLEPRNSACFRLVVNLLRTASLSRSLVLCQSQLGFFYKYSAFSVLSKSPFRRSFLISVRRENEHSTQKNYTAYIAWKWKNRILWRKMLTKSNPNQPKLVK